ncbi:MAG: PAS domain S-box-containing protein [Kiritimatiellia bacterium]|jgi:PAS domain S-box-containing protein
MAEPAYDIGAMLHNMRNAEHRAELAQQQHTKDREHIADLQRRLRAAEFRARAAESQALRSDTHIALAEARARAQSDMVKRYRSLIRQLPGSFVIVFDEELRYLVADGPELKTVGLDRTSLEGRTVHEIFPSEVAEVLAPMYQNALDGKVYKIELPVGDTTFLVHNGPLYDKDGTIMGGLVLAQDITATKQAEAQLKREQLALKKMVGQREVLLKEIYHRVKNNLQVISSLLNLQARTVADPTARNAMRACQARVRAMSMVHERLYGSEDLSRIEFSSYVGSLVDDLARTYSVSDNVNIHVQCQLVSLSLTEAIPCGLILHELFSNALQHAFPDERDGNVHVELTEDEHGIQLTIRDDGMGMPDASERRTGALGTMLIDSLTAQLDGTMTVTSDMGTCSVLRFERGVAV